jgi:ribosomal protein L20A (L18A)
MSSEEQYKTTTHEIAHLIDMYYYRISSKHGYRWQTIDIAMGGTGERCHKMEVKRNNIKRLVVKDNVTGRIYNSVTLRNYNKASAGSPGRYEVLECKTLNRTPASLVSA